MHVFILHVLFFLAVERKQEGGGGSPLHGVVLAHPANSASGECFTWLVKCVFSSFGFRLVSCCHVSSQNFDLLSQHEGLPHSLNHKQPQSLTCPKTQIHSLNEAMVILVIQLCFSHKEQIGGCPALHRAAKSGCRYQLGMGANRLCNCLYTSGRTSDVTIKSGSLPEMKKASSSFGSLRNQFALVYHTANFPAQDCHYIMTDRH